MKISYSDDTQKGPGHGIFTFSEALFPDGPYTMAVLRASDQASLAATDQGAAWVGESRFMPVDAEVTPEGGLAIAIGPGVVNALDPLEQYLVTLKPGQGDPLKARLQVRGITYSPDRALDNTGMKAQEAAPAKAAQPKPEPEPKPEPAPRPEPAPAEAAAEPLRMNPEPPAGEVTRPARRMSPVLVVAVLAALLAGGLATWKFFDSKAQEEEAALSGKPGPEAPATTLPATPKTAEEQVRAFFSGPDVTAAAALKLAGELPRNTPAEQDALYRLYYFAAGQEAPGAFMPYAASLDPAEPKWGTIEKDAAAAYAAYAKAAASDPKVAKQALEAQTRLRAWLEREAGAGNAQARAWLQELP